LRFENTSVFNMDNAIRGMRNPLASWAKSDSYVDEGNFILGPADLDLARRLIKGGTEHRKFMRQIMVSVDITAPLYWWKEFDTYKVGTTANSTSTMHKVMADEFHLGMFEFDDFKYPTGADRQQFTLMWLGIIDNLNRLRNTYLVLKDSDPELAKLYWKELIRVLPSAWLQTRAITMNYENLMAMYFHRYRHKLTEWHQYCDWVLTLPYTQALFGLDAESVE